MKKVLFILLIGMSVGSALAQSVVSAQRTNSDIDLRIPAATLETIGVFSVRNINGDLNVQGYEGDEILITGNKIISAQPGLKEDFDPSEFYLDTLKGRETLYVFVHQPNLEVYIEDDKLHYDHRSSGKKKLYDEHYSFEFNLVLKVPEALMSKFSTINKGTVVVEGMQKGVLASNVNGNIFLSRVNGAVSAHTVNGNIRIDYDQLPQADADFHTVNGTIEVLAPKDLSAVVTFKSFQGDLYTDFDDLNYLPKRVNRKKDGMTRYSISQTAPIQIGEGGPEMHFQLLNGNAYLKQRPSNK